MTTSDTGFEQLIEYITSDRGLDFTAYKRGTLRRRLEKRMHETQSDNYGDYMNFLEANPEEFTELLNVLLINVTAFFRDPDAWQVIADDVIPAIIGAKDRDAPIRVWSAGCSSGEETFTIAMLLARALGTQEFARRVKIYGTDIDEQALAKARHAAYSEKEVSAIPPELRESYFDLTNQGDYLFSKDLRRSVIFGRLDLLQDAPISKVDLLICRNTLMYFNAEAQARVIARFGFGLGDGGYLFLGKAETLLSKTAFVTPVNLRMRIFSKTARMAPGDGMARIVELEREAAIAEPRMARPVPAFMRLSFYAEPIPQFIVDRALNVVAANNLARRLFGIREEDMNRPFQTLEVALKIAALWEGFDRAIREERVVEIGPTVWSQDSSGQHMFDIQIIPLRENGAISALSVACKDVTEANELHTALEKSKNDLQIAYEELQSTNEELETTNEELETMNEELQSTNDELESVNDEVRLRGAETASLNQFLEAILSTLEVGVATVSRDNLVLSWNSSAEDLWGVTAQEVIGADFFSLDIGLPAEQIRQPILDCFADGGRHELTVDAVNRRGRSFQCRVRVLPLGKAAPASSVIVLMGSP